VYGIFALKNQISHLTNGVLIETASVCVEFSGWPTYSFYSDSKKIGQLINLNELV